jgi:hypothetical protein
MGNCDMREDCDPSEKGGLAAVERRRAKRRRCEREVGRVFERAVGFRESEGSGFARKRGYRPSR